jgi:hypothetical protein
MAVSNFRVEIKGLKELQDSLNLNRVNKEVATAVGLYTRKLHSELRFAIKQMYRTDELPNPNLDSVLLGNASETRKFGKNIIVGGLEYRWKSTGLAKFRHSSFIGNINTGAKRKGRVQKVQVRRGITKIVYGREHRGGFIPTDKDGRYLKQAGHINMYERLGRSRFPVRILWSNSLAKMADMALREDKTVQQSLANLESYIAERINL